MPLVDCLGAVANALQIKEVTDKVDALVKKGKHQAEAEAIAKREFISDEFGKLNDELNGIKKEVGVKAQKAEKLKHVNFSELNKKYKADKEAATEGNNSKEYKEGDTFKYKGKDYVIKSIGVDKVHASPTDKSHIALLLDKGQFEDVTGGSVKYKNPEDYKREIEDNALIKKVEAIKYENGKNAKQVYDKLIADGHDEIVQHKVGAVNKYFLRNDKTNSEYPLSGVVRTYVEKVLEKLKQKDNSVVDNPVFKDVETRNKIVKAYKDKSTIELPINILEEMAEFDRSANPDRVVPAQMGEKNKQNPFENVKEMTSRQNIDRIKESIKKEGFKGYLEISLNDKGAVALTEGNHRLQALKELGYKNIPVKVLGRNTVKGDYFEMVEGGKTRQYGLNLNKDFKDQPQKDNSVVGKEAEKKPINTETDELNKTQQDFLKQIEELKGKTDEQSIRDREHLEKQVAIIDKFGMTGEELLNKLRNLEKLTSKCL